MSKWFPMIAKSKMCEFRLFACLAAPGPPWWTFSGSPSVTLPWSCCDLIPLIGRTGGLLCCCVVCYPVSPWGSWCHQSVGIRCPGLVVLLSGAEIQALSVFEAHLQVLIVRSKWRAINHFPGRIEQSIRGFGRTPVWLASFVCLVSIMHYNYMLLHVHYYMLVFYCELKRCLHTEL